MLPTGAGQGSVALHLSPVGPSDRARADSTSRCAAPRGSNASSDISGKLSRGGHLAAVGAAAGCMIMIP